MVGKVNACLENSKRYTYHQRDDCKETVCFPDLSFVSLLASAQLPGDE